MTQRFTQVKKLTTPESLRDHLGAVGADLPVADRVDPDGVLASPVDVVDGSAGVLRVPNRFAVLPMEGWDGTAVGAPTDLVRRRWERFGTSGCGLVWGEATAVRADGRANARQLVLDERTAQGFAELRSLLRPDQVVGLQLTHSGRWSRPDGSPAPRIAYRHPLLDARVGADRAEVLADAELDELVECYVAAAVLAAGAGFDFVDVKHCHGYLLHELLTAHDRPGPYGGDLAGRTRFLRAVVGGIRRRAPGLAVAVRLSVFDLRPFRPGDDGRGEAEGEGPYRYAFGGDGSGVGIDLSEPDEFLAVLEELGIGLVCTTAGSPYYNPHIQRPAFFPPSDGYQPPEDPLLGVARQVAATMELARRHPRLVVIGSGYSYLQEWLGHVGEAVVGGGGAAMVGLGRMVLSYPDIAADLLAGRPLDRRRICRTFSDCTTAPRNGLVSGCYPLDDFYRDRPERVELAAVKQAARSPLR
jgi:NADPH2 dehydrogenase